MQTKKVPTTVGVISLRTRGLVMFNGKDNRSNIKGNKRSGPHSSQWNLLWHPPIIMARKYGVQIHTNTKQKYKI